MKKFCGLLIHISTSALVACAPFQDSPYSDELSRPERMINESSIARIGDIESDGVIRIGVFADSHQNYAQLDRIIFEMNQNSDLDFVANLGDFTNSAYNFEYDQFLTHFLYLIHPAVTVIGNHDALGAGPSLFKKVFGPLNSWFETTTVRFVLFHSANLEYEDEFDAQWLLNTVTESTKPVIIFTHVPLRDAERFKGDVASKFESVINHPNTNIVFNGHNHVYSYRDDNGTKLIQAPRAESRTWLLIEIQGNQLNVKQMPSGVSQSATLKN